MHPIRSIAVAVTTAPRKVDYLPQTLASIMAAGFDGVASEDDSAVGSYRNFKLALAETAKSEADACLIFQDDIQVARGLWDWLLAGGWPEDPARIGVVSLYTAGPNARATDGWHALDLTVTKERPLPWSRAYGALAIMMPKLSAERFLKANWKPESKSKTDLNLGQWCCATGLSWWLHSPSLVQHIGEVSTLHDFGLNDYRVASRFVSDVSQIGSPCPSDSV